jgi:hypothetical protein
LQGIANIITNTINVIVPIMVAILDTVITALSNWEKFSSCCTWTEQGKTRNNPVERDDKKGPTFAC